MYKILTLNNIATKGLTQLSNEYTYSNNVENPDIIFVRSKSLHEMDLNSNLISIIRLGSGTNNIPIDKCSEQGIVVFNTPSANSNAVKELVIASLIISSRNIFNAVNWINNTNSEQKGEISKLVEKNKSIFKGNEIRGKNIGIIGLGSIGSLVANDAHKLGMNVYGYDPFISINSAFKISSAVKYMTSINDVYKKCDYITLHTPLTDSTINLIDKSSISKMKNGVKLLNFSRSELVNIPHIKQALEENKISCYITDFPQPELIHVENVINIPHLGASTFESEDNCSVMAAAQIQDFVKNGNIINSVNLPNISMPRNSTNRLTVFHRNVPNMICKITSLLSQNNINIEHMQSVSKQNYAYAIFDTYNNINTNTLNLINNINGVIRIRLI